MLLVVRFDNYTGIGTNYGADLGQRGAGLFRFVTAVQV